MNETQQQQQQQWEIISSIRNTDNHKSNNNNKHKVTTDPTTMTQNECAKGRQAVPVALAVGRTGRNDTEWEGGRFGGNGWGKIMTHSTRSQFFFFSSFISCLSTNVFWQQTASERVSERASEWERERVVRAQELSVRERCTENSYKYNAHLNMFLALERAGQHWSWGSAWVLDDSSWNCQTNAYGRWSSEINSCCCTRTWQQ